MVDQGEQDQIASPYSTGGGGTVLEHRYGAVLLCHLLLGDPVTELGEDAVPVSVRFQDSAFSPVDDLVVVGRTADGAERRVSIGVRRAPKITKSDKATCHLLVSYLRVVTDHWNEVRAGRWRLGLAVTSPNAAVQQVRELAVIAESQPDEAGFRAAVAQPGRIGQPVRNRLVHLDGLVAKAATEAKIDSVAAGELVWRVLHALWLPELRLEGVDESDRTAAVRRLRTIVHDGSLSSANTVFSTLERLSARYAPSAATVTESVLRQHLSGIAIGRSPSHLTAWRVLDSLVESLTHVVRFRLTNASVDLEIERTAARDALAAEMERAASCSSAVVITGEPDVGKSALALKTARQLATDGAVVTTLSLRDVPATVVEFEALLGARLVTVLGGTAVGTMRLLVIDGAESVLEG